MTSSSLRLSPRPRWALCLSLLLGGCSLFDVVDEKALRVILSDRWERLADRYNAYMEVEKQRGNYRRTCELANEFKGETLKLCRVAHDRGLRSTCEEDGQDYLPYKCESIEDAQPFTLPTNPLL